MILFEGLILFLGTLFHGTLSLLSFYKLERKDDIIDAISI